MELTAKERVMLTFQKKETDRIAIFSEPRNIGFIEKMSGKKLTGTIADMQKITVEAYAAAGVDLIRSLMVPRWGIEKGTEYDVMWDGYLNWKMDGENTYTLEEAVEVFKRKWCSYGKEDIIDTTWKYMREVQQIQDILGDKIHFMPMVNASGLESMYHTVGIENFSIMIYEYSDVVEQGLENINEKALKAVEVVLEMYDGPAIHSCDDWGMKGTTLFSPDWMRKQLFPRLEKVVSRIKRGGRYFSLHSCGYVMDIIPDLIKLGVDHLDPLEITAGMNMKKIRDIYGDRLVLSGNADTNIYEFGTTEDVREEVRRCIDNSGGRGYFLDGGITPTTPVENVTAFFDEGIRYGVQNKRKWEACM